MTNPYEWHWWFAWYPARGAKWLCWNRVRLVGGLAPCDAPGGGGYAGDLGSGWDYA